MLALLRGRGHVTGDDVRDLAADVLRHRIVLSYQALSDGVTADQVIERLLVAVAEPHGDRLSRPVARPDEPGRGARSRRPPARAPARSRGSSSTRSTC